MSDFIKTNNGFINLDHVIDFRIDGGKHRVTVEFSLSNGNTPYTTHQNDSEIRYLHYPDNGYFSTPDDGIIVDVVEFMAHVKETSDNKRAEYLAEKSITSL